MSSANEGSPMETEPSSGAEILRPDSSRRDMEEDELNGLPVFGADEDEDELESSFIQKDKQSDERAEKENGRSVSTKNNDSGESVSCSQPEDGPLQNEGSTSSLEENVGIRDAIPYSPLKKIKDEPIDEDYDKALLGSTHSDISRVKEELENGDPESTAFLDELRISSVFSVRGNSDSITASVAAPQPAAFSAVTPPSPAIRPPPIVLQTQMQPHFQAHLQLQPKTLAQLQPHLQTHLQAQLQTHLQPQLQLQAQLQPQLLPQLQTQPPPPPQTQPPPQPQPQQPPPPAPVRICCSGCSKVLQKGQTAFQKKGSNQLFCSTVCLTGFTLPPPPSLIPKKTCHLCLKVIVNPKDLITVPVDSANTLKEFCSLSCLSIYKSRVEGLPEEDTVVRCAVCRNPNEIQHEVNHQGVLHRLCSDECFSHFRSSKRLSMSCCESCGNCTATGNYHLVQVEDVVKKFCSVTCINAFKQKSGKRVHCPSCQDFKAVDQMLEGINAQGVIEFYCSSRCVAKSQASCTLSGASFPCTNCQRLAVPQYHLAMPDGAIRNFCSYECVSTFQEKLHRSIQMNRGSHDSPNTGLHPPLPHHPSAQVCNTVPNPAPASNQNCTSPYVPASRPPNPQDLLQEQPEALGPVKLTCKQCQKQIVSKPEVLQLKNHVGLFCSRFCCNTYKRERGVKAVCDYCKEQKVAKELVVYEKQLRTFCCEGCKLLYKHDYTRQHGGQCNACAYCCNVTHKTIQNHFGGKLEAFCSEKCMSFYTVLFYEMAKCPSCKNQGPLKESISWDETVRHFCNLQCLLHFCSKKIVPYQPNGNGINTAATTAQAPLSLSKDMPVIGGVVSLASALAGNTAVTGALPTSNASSKIIGDASTQTDAAVNVDPQQRRMLKNKAVMCKPISDERSVQCDLEPLKRLFETVLDENGEKVRLVPVPIPVPTPVYIPVPMHLYTQYTPFPLGLPLPIPVPFPVPASQESAQPSSTKDSVPSQSSVEDEDMEKCKSRLLSHGDQGSTYSGDLESEARSTPFSWADPEDSSHNLKPSVRQPEIEGPKESPAASTEYCMLDLENDIPLVSNDCHNTTKEQKSSAKRRKRGKRGRRSSLTHVTSGVVSTPPSSQLQHMYGVKAWSSWVQQRTRHADENPLAVNEDVLDCSSEDLSVAVCRFISEVRRPNGQTYAPDSVYYLCLGIQQHLLENGRLENIFTDPLYNTFTTNMTKIIKDWECNLTPSAFLQSRIEESFLWECKQLGALSPFVLLNTLIYFGVKHLKLKTVAQHQQLSFSAITSCSRTSKHGKSSYLGFKFTVKDDAEREKRVLLGKRKRDDAEENVEYAEMPENIEFPLRCPVRLYEFYLSKCPDSVKESPDLFYLQPESSCHADSVWFSTTPLDSPVLDNMLSRILVIRDVHLEPKQQQQQSSTDEDTS